MLRFSASHAERLMACPGSGNLEDSIPGWVPPEIDPERGAKGKGHILHEILQQVADQAPADVVHIMMALEYFMEIRTRRKFKVLTEHPEVATWLQSQPKTTADVVLYLQDELHIIDWKTGKIPVSVFDNIQLLYYAVTYSKWAPMAKGVHLHIIQPWANNMQSTYVDSTVLQAFMLKAMQAEQLVLNHSTTLNPTDGGCRFCPANPLGFGEKGTPPCPAILAVMPVDRVQGLYHSTMDTEAILEDE